MEHTHGPNGEYIPAEPAAVEAVADAEAVEAVAETTTDGAVAVAEIEAARDVELARIGADQQDAERDTRLAELEGRVRGMQEILERIAPSDPAPAPEPAPVVIPDPGPAPEDEAIAPAPEPDQAPAEKPQKSKGFWGPAYR